MLLIQHEPEEENKGGIIAAANLLSFVGIAISSVVYLVFTKYVHLDPRGISSAASSITAISTAYVLYLLPEWFGRLILFFATRTVYRVHVIGRDNFPEKGGALLVCNHMSFVDAALLVAATDRPIRFIMHRDIYDHPVVKPFAKNGAGYPRSRANSIRASCCSPCTWPVTRCAAARLCASLRKGRSRVQDNCSRSAAGSSGS